VVNKQKGEQCGKKKNENAASGMKRKKAGEEKNSGVRGS